jgi:hypothetical protein
MVLSNSPEHLEELKTVIEMFYKKFQRTCSLIALSPSEDSNNKGWFSWVFLVDRKHVVRYSIGPSDRGYGFLSGVEMAVGPYFFGVFDFWSYEASQRFRMGTKPDDIVFNLKLLDEFLGYKHLPPP